MSQPAGGPSSPIRPVQLGPPKFATVVSQSRALLTRVSSSERILRGGFDDALLGSAKVGMVVGTRGIYWNNSITSGGEERPCRNWDELARTRGFHCRREGRDVVRAVVA